MQKMHRLQSRRDFALLFRHGKRIEHPFFRVVIQGNTLGYARFAFVAARTVEKRAVVRNRLRRRAREWFRTHPLLLSLPIDIALIFKKPLVTAPRKHVYEELEKITQRILGR